MKRASTLNVDFANQRWSVGPEVHDLSMPLRFGGEQPVFFGVRAAEEQTLRAGTFTGDVRLGGSCNCSTYSLTPHCNGTHTECVGHLTEQRINVRECCEDAWSVALLVSLPARRADETLETTDPPPQQGDTVLTRADLEAAAQRAGISGYEALVVRTLPNDRGKLKRNYDESPAPYFTAQAMQWIVQQNVRHLVVDLPSVDRANDQGRLTAHRIFWNIPAGETDISEATRAEATITELAYIDGAVPDGLYLLNLQIAPFAADAAPSRPLLLPMRRQ